MTTGRKVFIASSLIGAAFVVAILLFVVMPYMNRPKLHVSVDRNSFPVKGIDISHHNGEIDWDAVLNDTVKFVIIKATDGVGDTDRLFRRNYENATSHGFDVGAYHFFRYHRDGHQQAQTFLNAVRGLPLDFPLAIDLEEEDNIADEAPFVAKRLRDMVDDIRDAGYRVMIYVNADQYRSFIRDNFDDIDIWLASSRPPCETVSNRRLWQHSHVGQVDGISGNVDLNTFNGSAQQYELWIHPSD